MRPQLRVRSGPCPPHPIPALAVISELQRLLQAVGRTGGWRGSRKEEEEEAVLLGARHRGIRRDRRRSARCWPETARGTACADCGPHRLRRTSSYTTNPITPLAAATGCTIRSPMHSSSTRRRPCDLVPRKTRATSNNRAASTATLNHSMSTQRRRLWRGRRRSFVRGLTHAIHGTTHGHHGTNGRLV